MKIKLSDYVAAYLVGIGVDTVFAVSGGASLHLIHSIGDNPLIKFVSPHHEQAAAMAADGYARSRNDIGVAIATSGPGATNLITGMCCSFYDSIPVLFLTGQVSTFRMTGNTGVRQIGFQETPIVEICRSITKNSVTLSDPKLILYELEKAVYLAKSGRPGPVLIDIPDNLQREIIETSDLAHFNPEDLEEFSSPVALIGETVEKILELIAASERPILIAGWGLHLSGMEKNFIQFAEALNIPVAMTWGAADIIPYDHPLYIGTFGTHGTRHANFAVQNADLVISLGSRLDTKATGSPVTSFARGAKKVVVDIDLCELKKFEDFDLLIEVPVNSSLSTFFEVFFRVDLSLFYGDYHNWFQKIEFWRSISRELATSIVESPAGLDPYYFMTTFSELLEEDARVFVDTGCSIAWIMQAAKLRPGMRIFHDFNNTAMGWALPASIGSYFSSRSGSLYCVVGDGSFMMTLHELATVKHHKIPVKIFLINNSGYSMIRQTQDQWLGSNYYASSPEGGLSFPEYKALASAFDIEYCELNSAETLRQDIEKINKKSHSVFCNVIIPAIAKVDPQVKFGHPNEDMEPLLPRELFDKCMIIPPI